jgi:hypothetical protein
MHKAPPSMATSTLSSILDEYDELEATGNTQPSFSTDDASSSPTTALEQRRSITDELQDAKYDEAWHSRTSRKSKRESVCCRKKTNACAFESGKLHEAKRTGWRRWGGRWGRQAWVSGGCVFVPRFLILKDLAGRYTLLP